MNTNKTIRSGSARAARQEALVRALQARAPAPATLLETHISYVLLSDGYAYKIKKAVKLDFLDYSTRKRRRECCADEVRLNRRLAPATYLGIVTIRGTPNSPYLDDSDALSDTGPALDYAVKMRAFPQAALFDRLLTQGLLTAEQIDALAERIADFHAQAPRSPPLATLGAPAQLWRRASENFAALRPAPDDAAQAVVLEQLEDWSRAHYAQHQALLAQRRREGFVRECHGDLHLGNIALVDAQPLVFDCIEFNAQLRWIDVLNEVAFLAMDLDERGRPDLAARFINRYLEVTGDYAGLPCLPFYLVYRALVRAKIAGLRATQEAPAAAAGERQARARYIACARRASLPRSPQLLLMHGVSASGKSTAAQALVDHLGAVRLRSDVERKRLRGVPALARSQSPPHCGLYDEVTTGATYRRLAELARDVLAAGFPVVVDATSLKHWQRQLFADVAARQGVPLRIVSCRARRATIARRLVARTRAGTDASEADQTIVDEQLRNADPLSADEAALAIVFDGESQALAELLTWATLKIA